MNVTQKLDVARDVAFIQKWFLGTHTYFTHKQRSKHSFREKRRAKQTTKAGTFIQKWFPGTYTHDLTHEECGNSVGTDTPH